jgi:hypothetical protein
MFRETLKWLYHPFTYGVPGAFIMQDDWPTDEDGGIEAAEARDAYYNDQFDDEDLEEHEDAEFDDDYDDEYYDKYDREDTDDYFGLREER